jgi:hypothetical protein
MSVKQKKNGDIIALVQTEHQFIIQINFLVQASLFQDQKLQT